MLTQDQIMQKVIRRELDEQHDKRCVAVRVCPVCGGDLEMTRDDKFLDYCCVFCNKTYYG